MPMFFSMEPMIPSEAAIERSGLLDLALRLQGKASTLADMLKPATAFTLKIHMQQVNAYYTKLIEGISAHPHDIRLALQGHYSDDPIKRALQLESIAHIHTQRHLAHADIPDAGLLSGQCLQAIHREFYRGMPYSLMKVYGDLNTEMHVTPGEFRQCDVHVGRHIPPHYIDIPGLLSRWMDAYRMDRIFGTKRAIAAMSAHHRLLWIHPFLDGNGRVARLHTDLLLKHIGIGGDGIWCFSRGLAHANEEYKAMLARADFPRQGVTDGRGALSEGHLVRFCEFMLTTAIGQIEYMTGMLDLFSMKERIRSYVDDRNSGLIHGLAPLPAGGAQLLQQAFLLGEIPLSEIEQISGLTPTAARELVHQLKKDGLITEESSRLLWAIPEHAERHYLPNLVPDYN